MTHLSFEERMTIEERLNQKVSIHKIALELNRQDSSIKREIIRNRFCIEPPISTVQKCANVHTCQVMHACGDMECNRICLRCFDACNSPKCPEYIPEQCPLLAKSPFVCNGCTRNKSGNCRLQKYRYQARRAQIISDDVLKTSRQGVNLSPDEMERLDDLVSPLLLNGQSIKAVFMEHEDEIPCSERTLYNYVDWNYLRAKNIDLPRKVHFKKRHRHGSGTPSRNHDKFAVNRTYDDFKKYVETNPGVSIVEMDTVIGRVGGKCLLTLFFRSCSVMIAILLDKHTQGAVIEELNALSEAIGIEVFQRLFGVILTDRGSEFSNPYAIEADSYGEIKTRVFYCDPQCSWQKGALERNHEFIREILPTGESFDHLTQDDITLIMNHINSYPRESLNNHSPYEAAAFFLDQKLLDHLGYKPVERDEVILKPRLIKEHRKNK